MNHYVFGEKPQIAILIKDSYFNRKDIQEYYVDRLGLDCMAFTLEYPNNKVTANQAKEYMKKLLPYLVKLGITHLYVADSAYFKVLTKQKKAEIHLGYVLPCKMTNHEHLHVIYGVNYGQLMYNENHLSKLNISLDALKCSVLGLDNTLGDISFKAIYNEPERLYELLQAPMLAIDIETTGLTLNSELVSIAFASNEHDGMAFMVKDKELIKDFFIKYKGYKIFHNATFDIKQIIYHCFMSNPSDIQGMLFGLHTVCKNLHDTKVIAYLATNNTQGNELGLKELSHEFIGNYAVDVKDVTKLNEDELLEYNLKDTLATFYVFNKYYPLMLQDNQFDIYQNIMIPSLKVIIQMELIGLPVNMDKVNELTPKLYQISDTALQSIMSHSSIGLVEKVLNQKAMNQYNAKHKKQKTEDDFDIKFNPSSGNHLRILLYDVLELPVLAYTATKQPSTDNKTLQKLKHHTEHSELIQALLDYLGVQKIISTFVPVLQNATYRDGWYYVQGNFNSTGTVSGRWSSSSPNLQQIPSNSSYGKLIKECFSAKKGFIFCGADYTSLEAKIDALLTQDPAKLGIYINGYDSHAYNTYFYWKNQFNYPFITDESKAFKLGDTYYTENDTITYQNKPITVGEYHALGHQDIHLVSAKELNKHTLNLIKTKHADMRSRSKPVTFALQYFGVEQTLVNNAGFSMEEATAIKANHDSLYQASIDYKEKRKQQTTLDGYATVAFGLRVRTPVLAKTVLGNKVTPYQAEAEARTVGNAMFQSYCMLNTRCMNAFMQRVWDSEYKYDILPVASIHDANYFIIKDNIHVVKWVNDTLIKEMNWQDLPEIKHDIVGLGGELDLYPTWANPITLPNNVNRNQIKEIVKNHMSK